MIPHFHAEGHLPNAKSARLYLQQMNLLAEIMPPDEYALCSDQGYFTIRRANEFWSCNFSDQTIEQYLMRMLKVSDGLTYSWGIIDSTLTEWIQALPKCVLCNFSTAKDLWSSTQAKYKTEYIMSFSSGYRCTNHLLATSKIALCLFHWCCV